MRAHAEPCPAQQAIIAKRVMSFCELDEIAREGARRILIEALKAEVDDYPELIDVLDPRWSPSRQP